MPYTKEDLAILSAKELKAIALDLGLDVNKYWQGDRVAAKILTHQAIQEVKTEAIALAHAHNLTIAETGDRVTLTNPDGEEIGVCTGWGKAIQLIQAWADDAVDEDDDVELSQPDLFCPIDPDAQIAANEETPEPQPADNNEADDEQTIKESGLFGRIKFVSERIPACAYCGGHGCPNCGFIGLTAILPPFWAGIPSIEPAYTYELVSVDKLLYEVRNDGVFVGLIQRVRNHPAQVWETELDTWLWENGDGVRYTSPVDAAWYIRTTTVCAEDKFGTVESPTPIYSSTDDCGVDFNWYGSDRPQLATLEQYYSSSNEEGFVKDRLVFDEVILLDEGLFRVSFCKDLVLVGANKDWLTNCSDRPTIEVLGKVEAIAL